MGTLDDFALPTSMRLPFRGLWTKLSESIFDVDRCNSLGVNKIIEEMVVKIIHTKKVRKYTLDCVFL